MGDYCDRGGRSHPAGGDCLLWTVQSLDPSDRSLLAGHGRNHCRAGRLLADYRLSPLNLDIRFSQIMADLGIIRGCGTVSDLLAGPPCFGWILPFAADQVDAIYQIKSGLHPFIIGSLLVLIIGPAEEIFWRGFVQRRLTRRYGWVAGLLAGIAVYTLVHIWSFNLMLIGAAAICGTFWGLLFMITGNLWPCIISHALWDVVIFLLFPVT